MIELLRSPWSAQFDALIAQASHSLVLCAPYIGKGASDRVSKFAATGLDHGFQLTLLTDLSRDNILGGATDISAVIDIVRAIPSANVRFLPSLHAKVYIADEKCAIVTSGNLTSNSLFRNFEYGVRLNDLNAVRTVRRDVLSYAALGSPIDAIELDALHTVVSDLQQMQRNAQRTLRVSIKREFERRVRQVDDELLRLRAAGRTGHAIFADTILHLLRKRPMTTAEINQVVQRIHPDLCDDKIDRVINGQHFGKKWKHGVRTAQVYLRRRGDIRLEDGLWELSI